MAIDDKGERMGDEPCPMALVVDAGRADQLRLGIAEEAKRIGIERNVRAVLQAITSHTLEKLFAFFRRLDADAEDLDLLGNVPLRFVDKGRHLGPAPGSPAAAVEKDHRRRRP